MKYKSNAHRIAVMTEISKVKDKHKDHNGKIPIHDLGKGEYGYHNPKDITLKKIGGNKLALTANNGNYKTYKIIPDDHIPVLLKDHHKLHGNNKP